MVWFFERNGDRLQCEIQHQNGGDRYDLVITHPDGRETTESFSDPHRLTLRRNELQERWRGDGWHGPFLSRSR
jgi:hypothetical protein